jgi:hypothetical protein
MYIDMSIWRWWVRDRDGFPKKGCVRGDLMDVSGIK